MQKDKVKKSQRIKNLEFENKVLDKSNESKIQRIINLECEYEKIKYKNIDLKGVILALSLVLFIVTALLISCSCK